MQGKIISINISHRKGTSKKPINEGILKEGYGLIGDAHSGNGIRQVSLLGIESIERSKTNLHPGDFAENITTKGLDLISLRIGDRLRIGDSTILKVTKIGKECPKPCSIYYKFGDCIMPKEGIFCEVLVGGKVQVGDNIEDVHGTVPVSGLSPKKEKIRCIIFDLDGTLIDGYTSIAESFNYVMEKLGYPTQDPALIKRKVGLGTDTMLTPFVRAEDLIEAERLYRLKMKEVLLDKTFLLPGVKEILEYLKKKGIKLAVASNKDAQFANAALKHLGIYDYFDVLTYGDEIENMKPHPEMLNKIMERSGVSPAETIMVGDMTIDIETGDSAGVKTICVPTGSNTREELEAKKPFMILDNIYELTKAV